MLNRMILKIRGEGEGDTPERVQTGRISSVNKISIARRTARRPPYS
jgi:hypothetical protein